MIPAGSIRYRIRVPHGSTPLPVVERVELLSDWVDSCSAVMASVNGAPWSWVYLSGSEAESEMDAVNRFVDRQRGLAAYHERERRRCEHLISAVPTPSTPPA